MTLRPYRDHLRAAKGSPAKACRSYCAERRWRETDGATSTWYAAWEHGLADEVELACREMLACAAIARALRYLGATR